MNARRARSQNYSVRNAVAGRVRAAQTAGNRAPGQTHITRIQGKLGVRNRVEIAAWSWENRVMDT